MHEIAKMIDPHRGSLRVETFHRVKGALSDYVMGRNVSRKTV